MPAPPPPAPIGPVAGKGLRAAGRALDGIVELVLAVAVLVLAGNRDRIWMDVFLIWLAITGYEAFATARFGGTAGKRILGLRVVQLDLPGRPDPRAALRRGAISATFVLMAPIGTIASLAALGGGAGGAGAGIALAAALGFATWLTSMLNDPLGRGSVDRSASTMVIPERYVGLIATRDLPGFADAVRRPRMHVLGRIADTDVRVHGRLRRLDDSPVLAAAIGLLALAASVPIAGEDTATGTQVLVLMATSAAWIVAFVVAETRLIARDGATPGHRLAGLHVVDRRTGQVPRTGRSLLRAVVLGLTLYVPLLWPLLAVSLLTMRYGDEGRGLHDLAGATLVISDASLTPEEQRQRTMRMRMGRAG